MPDWLVEESPNGLALKPVVRRALGPEQLSWSELLFSQLSAAKVLCLYFPSRFELPVDTAATSALRTFGSHTGPDTLVSFWDPADPEFSRALALFELRAPPALVLVSGLRLKGAALDAGDGAALYAISITDPAVLGQPERLAAAVNAAHEVVLQGNPRQIAAYVRSQSASSLLNELGHLSAAVRDQLLLLKPRFGLPGGISLQIG